MYIARDLLGVRTYYYAVSSRFGVDCEVKRLFRYRYYYYCAAVDTWKKAGTYIRLLQCDHLLLLIM